MERSIPSVGLCKRRGSGEKENFHGKIMETPFVRHNTGKSSIMHKLRKLGDNYKKLFHEGPCLAGLRSLKILFAVPKPGVGLHLCFRGVR